MLGPNVIIIQWGQGGRVLDPAAVLTPLQVPIFKDRVSSSGETAM
jgi:hypothetical protein